MPKAVKGKVLMRRYRFAGVGAAAVKGKSFKRASLDLLTGSGGLLCVSSLLV